MVKCVVEGVDKSLVYDSQDTISKMLKRATKVYKLEHSRHYRIALWPVKTVYHLSPSRDLQSEDPQQPFGRIQDGRERNIQRHASESQAWQPWRDRQCLR